MRKLLPYIVLLVGFFLFAWAVISLNARKNVRVLNNASISGNSGSARARTSNSQQSTSSYTKVDSGEGSVEVSATYITPDYLDSEGMTDEVKGINLEKEFAFVVSLNTHSVDLTDYEIDKLSHLRNEQGQEYSTSSSWISLKESSHHRAGIIRFARLDNSGNPVIKPGAKFFELVIRDIAGVRERVFRWELPLEE